MKNQLQLSSLNLFSDAETFSKACRTVSGVNALVADAHAADYRIVDGWTWVTGSMNRHGVVRVQTGSGEALHQATWDIGSMRMPPSGFRITSRHGCCLIEALTFVRDRVLAQRG